MKGICHSKFFTNTVDCFESWEWIPRGFIEYQKEREYVSQGQVTLYIGQCTSGKSRRGQKCHMCYDRSESVNDISYQNVAD